MPPPLGPPHSNGGEEVAHRQQKSGPLGLPPTCGEDDNYLPPTCGEDDNYLPPTCGEDDNYLPPTTVGGIKGGHSQEYVAKSNVRSRNTTSHEAF